MADLPIIFSAPMVRALLDGRKTQTRRLLKPQMDDVVGYGWSAPDGAFVAGMLAGTPDRRGLPCWVGDRLWVREAFCYQQWHNQYIGIDYVADPGSPYLTYRTPPAGAKIKLGDRYKGPRYPSIYMPRWASRLTLTVTDVRVERLQEISEQDACAEGWEIDENDPVTWYVRLWDSLHGDGAWDANPWVVALTFTVEQRNIDA